MDKKSKEKRMKAAYRENAYIIQALICALSDVLNISENTQKLCNKFIGGLTEELESGGEEYIVINVNRGD